MTEIEALRIKNGGRQGIRDTVTEEVPLTIYLNGRELLTILCSPDDLKELTAGFLFSSGLISSMGDVRDIVIDRTNWISHVRLCSGKTDSRLVLKRMYTSGCGKGVLFYNALDAANIKKIANTSRISSEEVTRLMDVFNKKSVVFKKTGGVHSAALSDGRDILFFREDIGRHNALDKVIGEALMRGLGMENLLTLVSGRVSSEIIFKAAKMRSAFLISRSAPTDKAVRLAEKLNLTLVGFARGKRMNVYAGEERIT